MHPSSIKEAIEFLSKAFHNSLPNIAEIKNNQITAQLTQDELIEIYKKMLLLRRIEEKVAHLYSLKKIGGFCHLYNGQEAVAVGVNKSMTQTDTLITSYRCHTQIILCGGTIESVIAELLGKNNGCSKGKGGSMHMFHPQGGFYGGHGIVGAQVPIGTGLAFAMKYRNNGGVSFVMLGDGAINQGQVYESFNMAKLWGLPVIYIIENNGYAMGTSVERASSTPDHLYMRGISFGIPGFIVNGMDVLDVYYKIRDARDFVCKNKTPVIIECKTYRYRGHSMSDPAKYRTKEELEKYKSQDPLISLNNKISLDYPEKKDIFIEIEKYIKEKINQAVSIAEEAPTPSINELYTNIYS